ncbi:odorant receptor 131-2-like [Myxocyprinus asiaticus]|uniref:odorant receptor 131-2-like n=1 Tax=Myxocyprinus asiaticus TaxID=70543 RepID=UPI002222401F|nr:odorant receptor 131-2-like [Myxocyprinus asiaticus]
MNSTMLQYTLRSADVFAKNFIIVLLGILITSINGVFVFTFFRSSIFYNDPRYILYINLVINDTLMVCITVVLFVMSYVWQNFPVPFCITLLIIASATHKNTPLTLAGMAVERYIAICKPLHHSQICTVCRTYILISLIWIVGVIPGLADLIVLLIARPFNIFTKVTFCSAAMLYNTPYHEEQSKAMNGLYSSAVWVILLFTYCRVLVTARKATIDKFSATKTQNTILLHGIQLMLCMLSYITPVIDKIYAPLIPADRTKLVFLNYLLTNLVPRLLSPLIYGVRDKHFLKHMKGLFSCILHKVVPTKHYQLNTFG